MSPSAPIINILYRNMCRRLNIYIMGFEIGDPERTREKTIKILFSFILFPFSLEYEFQNYMDMNYSILRNILYKNIYRIYNFLYRRFWDSVWREKTIKINIIFIFIYFYFITFLSSISISKLLRYEFFHNEKHINILLYIQNPFNIFNPKTI